MRIQRGDREPGPPPPIPLKNHKNMGLSSKTGLDPLKNHKATSIQCWAIIGSASETPFKWRFAGGLMMARLSPHLKRKKNVVKVGPPLTKLSGSAQGCQYC